MPAPVSPRFLTGEPRVLRPGVPVLPPGVERCALPGPGALVLNLHPGDRLRVIDENGGQPAEIPACPPDNGEHWGAAPPGVKADCKGEGVQALLARSDNAAARLRDSLSRAAPGFSPEKKKPRS